MKSNGDDVVAARVVEVDAYIIIRLACFLVIGAAGLRTAVQAPWRR